MAVFVLPKWAKFNYLTKHWKLYQEFPARTHLSTRQSLENPAQQEVVAPAPWDVHVWLVDADCALYNPASPTDHDQLILVHVPPVDSEESVATLQQFSPPATTLLTDLTEARPLIRTELTVNSPHVSRQWDHPIETTGPMKRQRLNKLSPAERAELNRLLEDAVDAGLIRPNYREFGSPILFVRKADGSLRMCIDYRGLNEVTRKNAYPLPRVDDTLDELNDANFYTNLDLASGF
jgi:hypothetical protein